MKLEREELKLKKTYWSVSSRKDEMVEKTFGLVGCWLGIDDEQFGHLTESSFYSKKASPVIDQEVVVTSRVEQKRSRS